MFKKIPVYRIYEELIIQQLKNNLILKWARHFAKEDTGFSNKHEKMFNISHREM